MAQRDLPREAQADARTAGLRREERHENLLSPLLGDPASVVCDVDDYVSVMGRARDLDTWLHDVGHGVGRITHQIDDRLFEEVRIR